MQQMGLVHPVTGDRMQQVHTPKQTQGKELSFVITLATKHPQASENCVQIHEGSSCHLKYDSCHLLPWCRAPVLAVEPQTMTVTHTLVHTLGPGLDDNNRLALASE